jgi:hypothetical protein
MTTADIHGRMDLMNHFLHFPGNLRLIEDEEETGRQIGAAGTTCIIRCCDTYFMNSLATLYEDSYVLSNHGCGRI